MKNDKKPGWKERISNWVSSEEAVLIIAYISVFISGISLGISFAKMFLI